MPPVADRINVRPYLRNFWRVLSGQELRRDIRGYLNRRLPELSLTQPVTPGLPNLPLFGGIQISQMSATNGAGRAAAPPPLPSRKPLTPVPDNNGRPTSQPPQPAPEGNRLRTSLYFAGAAVLSAASAIFSATNIVSWVMPLTLLKVSTFAALSISLGTNMIAGLGLAFLLRAGYKAVRKPKAEPAPLPVAPRNPFIDQIEQINDQPRLTADLDGNNQPISLIAGYRDLVTLKTLLNDPALHLLASLREQAETKISELADDIHAAAQALQLLVETGDGQEYFIIPTDQQTADLEGKNITTLPEYAQCLGIGGVGEVFLAAPVAELETAQPLTMVAAKIIMPGTDSNLQAELRTRLEAKATAIDHQNVIKVLGHGQTYLGRPFILLEYIQHPTLKQVVRTFKESGNRPSIDKINNWMSQILSAMAASHDAGIFHRDLKLENIYAAKQPVPRTDRQTDLMLVADFGMAKLTSENLQDEKSLQDITRAGEIPGTLSYLPPEATILQTVSRVLNDIEKARWNAKWDIYALGNIFYRLLTLKPPFEIKNGGAYWHYSLGTVDPTTESQLTRPDGAPDRITVTDLIRSQIQKKDASAYALPARPSHIPEVLWEIVTRMLAYHPLERYDSCKEALADLQAYQTNQPLPSNSVDPSLDNTRLSQQPGPDASPQAEPSDATTRVGKTSATGLQGMLDRLSGPEQADFINGIINWAEPAVFELSRRDSLRLERALGDLNLTIDEAADQATDPDAKAQLQQRFAQIDQAINLIRATRTEQGQS